MDLEPVVPILSDVPAAVDPAGKPRRLLPLLLALALVVGLVAIGAAQRLDADVVVPRPVLPSGPAPDFALTTFDGETLHLSDLNGRPVVLNFWASWCAPCRQEAAALASVARATAGRVAFLGVDVRDREQDARAFIDEYDVPYPNGPDSGQIVEGLYGGAGLPMTVFISADGTIERVWLGPLDEQRLAAFVEELA